MLSAMSTEPLRAIAVVYAARPITQLLIGLLLIAGCGEPEIPRYQLTGKVTFDSEPIGRGWIVFKPDQGPGAVANIEDGIYSTRDGWGTVGGLHTIDITAFDGVEIPDPTAEGTVNPMGSLVFQARLRRDIPKETSVWNIELTAEDFQRQ